MPSVVGEILPTTMTKGGLQYHNPCEVVAISGNAPVGTQEKSVKRLNGRPDSQASFRSEMSCVIWAD